MLEIRDESVLSFISQFNKDVGLVGGLINGWEIEKLGCLGYFKSILEQNDIQADYIPGCTF